jgi:hypothetical protein
MSETFVYYALGFAIGVLAHSLIGHHAFLAAAVLCGYAAWGLRRAD